MNFFKKYFNIEILVYIIIFIIIFVSVISMLYNYVNGNEIDYNNFSDECLIELLASEDRLIEEQNNHKETLYQYGIALEEIKNLQIEKNQMIVKNQILINELNSIHNFGDIAMDLRIGGGTSIFLNIMPKLYLYDNLYFFMDCTGIYGGYLSFSPTLSVMGTIGLGYRLE